MANVPFLWKFRNFLSRVLKRFLYGVSGFVRVAKKLLSEFVLMVKQLLFEPNHSGLSTFLGTLPVRLN